MCPGTCFGSFQWSVVSCSLETYWTRSGARQMPAVDVTHLYIHLQTLSTDYQHLIFHELCPAAARVSCFQTLQWWAQCWLLFRAGSVSPFSLLQLHFIQSRQGALSGTQTIQGMSLSFVSHLRWQYGLLVFHHLLHFQQWLGFYPFQTTHSASLWFLGLLCVASQGGKG